MKAPSRHPCALSLVFIPVPQGGPGCPRAQSPMSESFGALVKRGNSWAGAAMWWKSTLCVCVCLVGFHTCMEIRGQLWLPGTVLRPSSLGSTCFLPADPSQSKPQTLILSTHILPSHSELGCISLREGPSEPKQAYLPCSAFSHTRAPLCQKELQSWKGSNQTLSESQHEACTGKPTYMFMVLTTPLSEKGT